MPFDTQRVLRAIEALELGEVRLMEVCGTHTMAIAKSGIRSLLPENVKLLSGPGCPVCVTPPEVIDAVLELAMRPDVILTTYGDMVRVPGSTPGDNLSRRRALGARVEVVYSPVDAVKLARENPDKEVVFLGVGFETTAPGTAAAVLTAQEQGVENFSLFSMLKTVEPALRALIASEGFNVQGFLCPGHVATILGEEGFRFLPEEFGLPAVISGFEGEDILFSVYLLLRQLADQKPRVQNEYTRAVAPNGNPLARAMMEKCFAPRRDIDAEKKFAIRYPEAKPVTACRCGEVITGRLAPQECPLFSRRCTPEDPVGPCMVSSEGACAAAYKYKTV